MKKIYTTILISAFTLMANAVIIPVSITSNAFTPANFPANIGDQVVWTLNAGIHTTESTAATIPPGATPWASGTMSVIGSTYTYIIGAFPGTYGYFCQFHGATGMVAQFTVNPAGIFNPSSETWSLYYPNPCMDKITVRYNDADQIIVYDMLGNKMKSVMLDVNVFQMEIETATLPQGVYFFRTMKEGEIVSTKKIVKA